MKLFFPSILAVIILVACNSQTKESMKEKENEPPPPPAATVPLDYDLVHPVQKWTVPSQLLEISGQAWVDKNHLLAVEDAHPTLYLLRLDSVLQIEKTIVFDDTTGKKFDLEDVAILGSDAYGIWSQGKIYKIANWNGKFTVTKYKTGLDKTNNTEGLCYDPVSGNMLVACKDESEVVGEAKSTRSIFTFDMKGDTLKADPFLLIETKDLEKLSSEKFSFYPSAIAVHPKTHDVYVLSTKDTKVMARYSYKGELLALQFFDKDLIPQPEGICFAPDGAMFISSEGKNGDPAVIYKYAYIK